MGAKRGQKPGRGSKPAAPSPSKSAGRTRLALVVFGALFVVLFAGFAIAQGIGGPSVPEGDVALVEGVPEDISTVSKEEFAKAMLQSALQSGLKAAPKLGDKQYEEVKETALGELLDAIWIQGQGEEMGIEVTPKQIATELEQIKEQNFPTEAAFQKFLKESKFTQEDVDKRVKLQILSGQIQQRLTNAAPPATSSEIEDYYEAAKSTQYTQPPSRDIRTIVNKDAAKLAEAKAALEKDDSPKSWKAVAKKYSEDSFTKSTGGLQQGVTAESGRFPENLEDAMFTAAVVTIEGPVKTPTGSYIFQVEKTTPEKVQTLKEVRSQISSQLTQQAQQESFSEFIAAYQSKWTSRTFCAEGYEIERCSNFPSSKRLEKEREANIGCYEADPKGGRPEACPAPVTSASPAMPGSTSILSPQGERLPQRPRPPGLKEEEGGAMSGLEGLPPGATEAPPPEEAPGN